MSDTLRMDRMPHIWCPGCGIGSEVNSFADAVKRSGIDPKKLVVVSGIGCTGRVAGYVNFDSIHTTSAELTALMKSENDKWVRVVRDTKSKID